MADMGSGAYLRVKRDDKWQNIEVEYLTQEEMKLFSTREPDELVRWMNLLAELVRAYQNELNILYEEMKLMNAYEYYKNAISKRKNSR